MNKTILIVDDEPDLVELVGEMLARAGCVILKAGSGEEALRVLAENKPDLIIADITMPDMGGLELAQKIRADARLAKTPMLLLSGMINEDHEASGLQEGDFYMSKPVSNSKLLQKVKDILG